MNKNSSVSSSGSHIPATVKGKKNLIPLRKIFQIDSPSPYLPKVSFDTTPLQEVMGCESPNYSIGSPLDYYATYRPFKSWDMAEEQNLSAI